MRLFPPVLPAALLVKRSFDGVPPATLSEQLQTACLQVSLDREQSMWAVFRHMLPEPGSELVRRWLLHHDPHEVVCIERAATPRALCVTFAHRRCER